MDHASIKTEEWGVGITAVSCQYVHINWVFYQYGNYNLNYCMAIVAPFHVLCIKEHRMRGDSFEGGTYQLCDEILEDERHGHLLHVFGGAVQPADRHRLGGVRAALAPNHCGGRRLAHRGQHRPALCAHVDNAVVRARVQPAGSRDAEREKAA